MSAPAWAAFLVAAGVGAVARLLLDGWVRTRTRTDLPWGTLVVNVAGSLAVGIVAGLAAAEVVDEPISTVLQSGAIGAFTTFSTFGVQTARLAIDGRWWWAGANLAANLVLGVAAVVVGVALVG